MRSNAAPLFVRVGKVFGVLPRSSRRMVIRTSILGDLRLKMCYFLLIWNLDSTRCLKGPSVKSTPIEVPGTETAKKAAKVFE
jgi:hypothetical protein